MGEIPTTQSEKTIQSVRKMLRDKKNKLKNNCLSILNKSHIQKITKYGTINLHQNRNFGMSQKEKVVPLKNISLFATNWFYEMLGKIYLNKGHHRIDNKKLKAA